MQFEEYRGPEAAQIIDDLASLRITVFREFPYLYEGNLNYEQKYLATYTNSKRSLICIVRSPEGKALGATTCLPLADEEEGLQGNFKECGYDVDTVFYFGESIILPPYRGKGLGKKFFEARESHAQSFGSYKMTSFCAVVRPESHPLKPNSYKSPETLWKRMGYGKLEGVTAHYPWQDLGDEQETKKKMQFWAKQL